MNSERDELLLVYDRQCPFCDSYCRMIRINETVGKLRLIDARDSGPEMDRINQLGLDIDQGMVLIAGEQLYYGSDAIHALSLLSSRSGLFNRINFLIFRSKNLSRALYPVLRTGRNLALKLMRRSRINNLQLPGNDRY